MRKTRTHLTKNKLTFHTRRTINSTTSSCENIIIGRVVRAVILFFQLCMRTGQNSDDKKKTHENKRKQAFYRNQSDPDKF